MKKLLFLPIVLIVLGGIAGNALRFTERKPDRIADFLQIPLDNTFLFGYLSTQANKAHTFYSARAPIKSAQVSPLCSKKETNTGGTLAFKLSLPPTD